MLQQDVAKWVDQMALLLDLPLDPDHRAGVIENWIRIQGIAQPVLEFSLPEEIEAATVFQP